MTSGPPHRDAGRRSSWAELVLGGHLQEEPSAVLVAEMLSELEADEGGLEADELSEEANPT